MSCYADHTASRRDTLDRRAPVGAAAANTKAMAIAGNTASRGASHRATGHVHQQEHQQRQQLARTNASEDALRRKQAVFGARWRDSMPPQPPDPGLVQDIVEVVRDWSAGG